MALIDCPDCGRVVSSRAATCLKCGRPIANPVEPLNTPGVPVQTIEKTSKKLKGCQMAWFAILVSSVMVLMAGGSRDSDFLIWTGLLMFLVSVGGLVAVKFKIWWEHK